MAKRVFCFCCFLLIIIFTSSTLLVGIEEDANCKLEQFPADYNNQGFPTLSFDLNTGLQCYSKFLQRLRNIAEAPIRVCGLPSTRKEPLKGKEYILVILKFSNTEWVTLGLQATNLYVWAYQDNVKYGDAYRANFLNDAPEDSFHILFPGSSNRKTGITGEYTDLERLSNTNRYALTLGIPSLEGAIRSVYRKSNVDLKTNIEAKFILICIQMISEAARFKLTEKIIINGDTSQVNRGNMISFQNDWDAISKGYFKEEAAKPKCLTFSPPLQIGNAIFHNLKDVTPDLGIIKYYTPKKQI